MFLKITLLKYISYKKKKKKKHYQGLKNILDCKYMYNSKIIASGICKKGFRENQLHITIDFVNMFSV